jgi:endoglucanase
MDHQHPLSSAFRRAVARLVVLSLTAAAAISGLGAPSTQAASNYLHTSGSQILDSANHVVNLSGLNWFGFETSNAAPHGLWSRNWEGMLDQIKSLGYNVIRLPYSNAMLKAGVMPSGIDYALNADLEGLSSIEVMDRIIAGAGSRGIKIILDNHRSTPGGGPESGGLWYTSGYTESDWIADWTNLVSRYNAHTTVIGVDLRNEPYGGCWGCGDAAKDWRLAAQRAGNAILATNPNLLIIVEGVSTYDGQSTWWGGNLMGAEAYPVQLSIPNRLVYSPHEYPASVSVQPWFSERTFPNNLPAVWDKYWGYLARRNIAPILIGELGSRLQTTSDQEWMQALQAYIRQNSLGWTFWSLNPNSGDTGGLLLDDWQTVDQTKQGILSQIQYPFIDSGTSITPAVGPTASPYATATGTPPAGPSVLMLDNFESGTTRRWQVYRDANSSVTRSIFSPGWTGHYAMKVSYRIASGGWGGVEQKWSSPMNWTGYSKLVFAFYGSNTGNPIRVELYEDRAPGSTTDTSERFSYRFTDNFTGWRTISVPWNAFTRRGDWQPAGAPNNGLTLTQVWGYNISPIRGSGSFRTDQHRLVRVTTSADDHASGTPKQGSGRPGSGSEIFGPRP